MLYILSDSLQYTINYNKQPSQSINSSNNGDFSWIQERNRLSVNPLWPTTSFCSRQSGELRILENRIIIWGKGCDLNPISPFSKWIDFKSWFILVGQGRDQYVLAHWRSWGSQASHIRTRRKHALPQRQDQQHVLIDNVQANSNGAKQACWWDLPQWTIANDTRRLTHGPQEGAPAEL